MQTLFFMDMSRNFTQDAAALYCRCFPPGKKAYPFLKELTEGVMHHRSQIDQLIKQFSENWKLHRISCVDRNIMRVAIYEMMFSRDIPMKVSINEAIDIGKKYGTEDSGAFINGILDSVHLALEKGEIQPSEEWEAVPQSPAEPLVEKEDDEPELEVEKYFRKQIRPGIVRRRNPDDIQSPDITNKQ